MLGIYPEGTRSPDGKLYRGRTGVARMILEGQVPVVPVAMVDTEKIMPIGTRLPKVGRIGIIIGEPLDFSRFEGMEGDRFILRSVTDEIMYALQRAGRAGVRRRLRQQRQGKARGAFTVGSVSAARTQRRRPARPTSTGAASRRCAPNRAEVPC